MSKLYATTLHEHVLALRDAEPDGIYEPLEPRLKDEGFVSHIERSCAATWHGDSRCLLFVQSHSELQVAELFCADACGASMLRVVNASKSAYVGEIVLEMRLDAFDLPQLKDDRRCRDFMVVCGLSVAVVSPVQGRLAVQF